MKFGKRKSRAEATQTKDEAGASAEKAAGSTKKSKSTLNQPWYPPGSQPSTEENAQKKEKKSSKTKSTKGEPKPKKAKPEASYQVFVGGVGDISEERLVEHFSQFGTVESAVVVKDQASGKSRGFGFVTFVDKEGMEKAAGTKQVIDGKPVECRLPIPPAGPAKEEEQDGWECFVGGLPKSVEAGALENYFKKYGEVLGARILIDAVSQQSRGFGFVQFASKDNIAAVLDGKHTIEGAVITTKIAENKKTKQAPVAKNNAVFLGGLPKSVTEQELRELCGQFGEVNEVILKIDSVTGNCRGFAFVTFFKLKAFTKCLEAAKNGTLSFNTRQISARPARSKSSKESYYPKGEKEKKKKPQAGAKEAE